MNNQKVDKDTNHTNDYHDEIEDFIGREEELKTLTNAIAQLGQYPKNKQANLIFIKGEGGAGKTVITRELRKQNEANSKIISIEYDFDENTFHSTENLLLSIALKLGSVQGADLSFNNYLEQHKNVEDAKKSGSRENSAYIKSLQEKAINTWLKIIENSQQNFVFYFDTIDLLSKIQIDLIARYFFSKVPKNSLYIISGRPNELLSLERSIHHNTHTKHINLQPFSDKEINKFILKKIYKYGYSTIHDLPIDKPFEFIDFIKKASRGLPILIGLALEQFSSPSTQRLNSFKQNIDILQKKELDTQNEHNEFKSILIHHFLENFSNELKNLVLVLAHAWPLGEQAIQDILDYGNETTKAVMDEARRAIYIKRVANYLYGTKAEINSSPYYLSLHDVMREMINEFTWDKHDKDKIFRIEISRIFKKILKQVIAESEQKVKKIIKDRTSQQLIESGDQLLVYHLLTLIQRLRIQSARHTTCLDIKEGLALYVETLRSGKIYNIGTQSQYIDFLSHHIEGMLKIFHHTDIYKLLQEGDDSEGLKSVVVDYIIEKLDFLSSRNRLDEVNKLVSGLNKIRDSLSFNLRTELFAAIATSYLKNGKLKDGLELLQDLKKECVDENTKKAYILLFPVYIQMGWAYRLLSNIIKADDCYSDAENLFFEHDLLLGDDIELIELASLYQTWAYTKALLGELRHAKEFINIASSKFKEIGFELGEGYIQSVSGRIQIEFDDYEGAIHCFEKAKGIFPEDNHEWQSKILLGMAQAHIMLSEYQKESLDKETVKQHIDLACTYLHEVAVWNYPSEQPEANYIFGNLLLQKKEYEKAEKYYIKTWKVSQIQGSLYYLYRSLIGQVRVAIFNKLQGKKCKSVKDFEEIHITLVHDHSGITEDRLAEAIFWKSLGDLRFLEGDRKGALDCYKKNLPIIGEKGRFYAISLKGQLDRTGTMFLEYVNYSSDKIDIEKENEVHQLAQDLWDYWKDKQLTRKYLAANPVIHSWVAGKIDEWNHPSIKTNNNE